MRAERARAAERQGIPEEALYPLRLVEIAFDGQLVSLTTPKALAAVGIEAPVSILTPVASTRAIGAAAADTGIPAIRVPSVAASGDNLVIYPQNLKTPISVVTETPLVSVAGWP